MINPLVLPYVYIAGAGGDFHLRAAAAHRPFQFLASQRALHGNREIRVNRAGAGVYVQIKAAPRPDRQANGSRASVEFQRPAHAAVSAEITAAASRAQTAFEPRT